MTLGVGIFATTCVASFFAAFAIGANDVANTFATSVGAKVLTLRQALGIAAVFEFAGSVFLGGSVSNTIRSGLLDINLFQGQNDLLMLAFLSSLIATTIWLLIATFLKLPVSGTHSIVGAVIGFAVVLKGWNSVTWSQLGIIAITWVASPLLAGFMSIVLFFTIRRFVLRNPNSLERGLVFLPIFYAFTLAINVFFILYGSKMIKMALWLEFVIAGALGIISGVLTVLLVVPWLRKRVHASVPSDAEKQYAAGQESAGTADDDNNENLPLRTGAPKLEDGKSAVSDAATTTPTAAADSNSFSELNVDNIDMSGNTIDPSVSEEDRKKQMTVNPKHPDAKMEQFDPKTEKLFSFLQVITAAFGSFAHGANDVSNAIAPLAGVYAIYTTASISQTAPIPFWLLAMGGCGIVAGLLALGKRVIETVGTNLTEITPSRGFTMELGTAMTVIIATMLGIPVSTTHCKIGSVTGVGALDGQKSVNWKLFAQIGASWIVTLPISAVISAGVVAALQAILL